MSEKISVNWLIHMICGASQSDILLRISAEVLIINLVSVVVSSLIFSHSGLHLFLC